MTIASVTTTTASATTSTTATGMGGTCTWSPTQSSCSNGDFCQPSSGCGSGHCVTIPSMQVYDPKPVCGCDGVTYWNTSVAHSFGVPVKTEAACGPQDHPTPCMDKSDCPKGRACSHQVSNAAACTVNLSASGTCVGLPLECGKTQPMALSCESAQCDRLCDLINLSKRYAEVAACP